MSGEERALRDAIERELREMTAWRGDTGRVWGRAIEAEGRVEAGSARRAGSRPARAWHRRPWVIAASGLAAAGLLVSVAIVPQLRRADASAHGAMSEAAGAIVDRGDLDKHFMGAEVLRAPDADMALKELGDFRYKAAAAIESPDRSLVRKATVEITTADVRAAAMKARQLLSEPKGEYLESSDIDDSDEAAARADLVLRVEASRLEEVVTQLRELGEVESEQVYGEDVTDQLVDLGARLENERRIEKELAELLEKRPDDKLEEILAVRRELGAVRERIEQLAAQRENLSRMVRLARVALMLRTGAESDEPAQGLWEGFVEELGVAWREGAAALLATVAGIVRVVIAGAIWFALAGAALAIAWRRWRAERPRPLATA